MDRSDITLDLIVEGTEGCDNWTRRSTSNAGTGIGLRSAGLERAAPRTAARMDDVDVDPRQTSCVLPDSNEYRERITAYRVRQATRSMVSTCA